MSLNAKIALRATVAGICLAIAGGAHAADSSDSLFGEVEIDGLWRGQYICAQGVTGVDLTIETPQDAPKGNVTALFEFYPLPENPTETGAFEMTGSFDAVDQVLILDAEAWVEQPEGWIMVGLKAAVGQRDSIMTGRIDTDGCGGIFLERMS